MSAGTNSELARIYQTTASIQSQTASLLQFTASQDSRNFTISQITASFAGEIGGLEAYSASLKAAAIVSSSTQVQNYDLFGLNSNLYRATGSLIGITNGLMAFTAALDNTYATDAQLYQLYQATRSLELLSGSMIGITNGLMAYTSSNETWKTGVRGEISAIEAWTASLDNTYATDAQLYELYAATASINTTTGSLKGEIAGIEAYTASLKGQTIFSGSVQIPEIGGLESYTASLKAAAIVSSSTQIQNYFTFAQTSSVNTFYGDQTITGSLKVNGGITGSFKGNLAGVADYAATISIGNASANSNYAMLFTTAGVNGYLTPSTDAFGGVLYNPSTNKLTVSGSSEISGSQIITGSLLISGSTYQTGNTTLIGNTVLSGSINISGSTTFTGTHTLAGSNTITGNTVLSGSFEVSGSTILHNSLFEVTGSAFFTGSHDVKGNASFTGSMSVTGNTTLSGSINIASGSGFYRAGNKLFNYGQFFNTQTQSGSANTAYPMEFNTLDFADGVNITNNGSGLPTRLTVTNTGVYNIQFSAQLGTTATETVDFSIWLARTGSAVTNTNGQIQVIKSAGGGNVMAAWNYMIQLNAGEYAELYYSKTTANGQIQYLAPQGTPTRPATPSTIVTVTQHA